MLFGKPARRSALSSRVSLGFGVAASADAFVNAAAAVIVALIGAATSIYVARRDDGRAGRARGKRLKTWRFPALLTVIFTLILVSILVLRNRDRREPSPKDVFFTIDDGSVSLSAKRVLDSTGDLVGNVVGQSTALSLVDHPGAGKALKFPPPCEAAAPDCPRVIIEVSDSAELNPRNRSFSFGAAVQVDMTEQGSDSTVMEKGLPNGNSEWKLKIEASGQASCVVVSTRRITSRAVMRESVVDGKWRNIECRKSGTALVIAVDGVERGRAAIDESATVENEHSLRIGGYRLTRDNNQFHGAMDDLFFRVHEP